MPPLHGDWQPGSLWSRCDRIAPCRSGNRRRVVGRRSRRAASGPRSEQPEIPVGATTRPPHGCCKATVARESRLVARWDRRDDGPYRQGVAAGQALKSSLALEDRTEGVLGGEEGQGPYSNHRPLPRPRPIRRFRDGIPGSPPAPGPADQTLLADLAGSWKTGSSFSTSTLPKPSIPPRSQTPFVVDPPRAGIRRCDPSTCAARGSCGGAALGASCRRSVADRSLHGAPRAGTS